VRDNAIRLAAGPPGFSSEVGMDAGTEIVLKESIGALV